MEEAEVPRKVLAVRFFKTATGREPVRAFLKALTADDRKLIGTDIKEVQIGWPLGMPLVRKMGPGLWELRSRLERGIARTFFTVLDSEVILLHSFIKKSQKTPKNELEIARDRRKELEGD